MWPRRRCERRIGTGQDPLQVSADMRCTRDAMFGAGEGNRTLVCSLGSCRSTIELRPRVALCSEHDLFGKPATTFPDHAAMISRHRAIRQAFRCPSRLTVNFRKIPDALSQAGAMIP